jgi:hypothetical protein
MRLSRAVAAGVLPLLWFACTPLDSENDSFAAGAAGNASQAGKSGDSSAGTPSDASGNAAGQAPTSGTGSGGDTGGDAGAGGDSSCPRTGERDVAELAESAELTLSADTTWSCHYDYRIRNNVIVGPGVKLSIAAGTTVRFDPDTLLLVQRGGRLEAEGSAAEPITLTSSKPAGTRAPGDYRGLILAGSGPSHSSSTPVHDSLSDARAHYGGGQGGDPESSCGVLRYLRIEFAGGSIDDPALPAGALTLAGCGVKTVVDYVQVQRATDGIGLLGGTVPLRHVVVSNNLLGEAIEWSAGYTGTMQFVVAQSLGASAALQGSNSADDPEASPVSRPTIYNATLIGRAPLITGQHYGVLLQFGSRLVLKNSIVQGFADTAFDLRLDDDVLATQVGPGKPIDISHALLHANTKPYSGAASVLSTMESMRMQDPGLASAANPTEQMPDALPVFAPTDPTVNTQPAVVPNGFDSTAGFRGGVAQDGQDWTQGWTSYPVD